MTCTIREELIHAERLLQQGEYRDALELVEALAAREGLPADDRLACFLLESRLTVKLGELAKALALTEEVLQITSERENPLLVVDLLTVKAEASWRSGELDEGLGAVEEGEALLAGIELERLAAVEGEIERREGDLLHHRGIISWYRGDLDMALEYHQRSRTIKERLGNRRGLADSFNNLGLVYWSRGDLDQALDYYQQGLTINEELGNKRNTAITLTNVGNVYSRKGDLDQALACQKRSLAIKEELGHKHDIFTSLINLGAVYQLKGDLSQAKEHYQRSLAISEELGIKRDIALAINNLGNIDQLKGDLNQALEYFQTSLAIYRELGIREEIALLLTNIGEIHSRKGNLERALECYERSLATYEQMGNDPLTAIVLTELVWIALESGAPTLAQQHLQKLQQINERTDNRSISQRYRVARALSLKASKRARDKVKAEEILAHLVEEEVADHSLTVTAMIHLCDLLLFELKMTGEDELFGEIKDLTYRLLEIAKQQSSHSLLAETYLLQSKLALIELDMGRARTLLTEAHAIAEEKGLHMLARAVAHERDLLQSQVQMWELIIQRKPSRREMIDLTQLDDLLEQMVQRTVAVLTGAKERVPGEEAPKGPFVQGTLNERYRLDAEIGRGGMGAVYRAHDTLLKRDVAVKVLSETGLGTEGRARLLREAQSAAQLNHPNVVSVYDAGEVDLPGLEGTAPFIVMELVEGESLHIRRPHDLDEILVITRQVCGALEHAHAHGIIHRDLKPENVMITPDGTAKLMDFGLARTLASRLTAEGTIIGTVFYLAPEQALGQEVDRRVDLYALGVLLYELTTGRLPFDADDPVAVISQHLHAPVVSPQEHNPEIPHALEDLILRLLSKGPEDRPASAAEVEKTLAQLIAGER
jgi:tetratricopeptide (TPR) repeat protein